MTEPKHAGAITCPDDLPDPPKPKLYDPEVVARRPGIRAVIADLILQHGVEEARLAMYTVVESMAEAEAYEQLDKTPIGVLKQFCVPAVIENSDDVLEFVSSLTAVTVEEICGTCRSAHIVNVRQTVIYILKSHLKIGYQAITKALGRRTAHTTAVAAFRRVSESASLRAAAENMIEAFNRRKVQSKS